VNRRSTDCSAERVLNTLFILKKFVQSVIQAYYKTKLTMFVVAGTEEESFNPPK